MRWVVALLLALVIAGGAAVLLLDRPVRSAVGLPVTPEVSAPTGVSLDPAKVSRVELTHAGQQLVLTRDAAGNWTQPGEWPVREKEVADLLAAVGGLKTRYLPVPVGTDLKPLGLDPSQNPYRVSLTTDGTVLALAFGKAADGSAYVRTGDAQTALRIAPDVLAVVARSPDTYRRRQLFPNPARVKLNADGAITVDAVPLPADPVRSVSVSGPDGAFTLTRLAPNPAPRRDPDVPAAPPAVFVNQLAEAWELVTPAGRDRVDPAKLRTALAAVPELWVEGFPQTDPVLTLTALAAAPLPFDARAVLAVDNPEWQKDLAARHSGFSKERVAELAPRHAAVGGGPAAVVLADQYPKERELTVTTATGSVTLRVGAVSRTEKGEEPPPPVPGQPPPPSTDVTYHFARLENNPLPFEVRADRLPDLFAKPDDLRDPLVARFSADEVRAVEVSIPKTPDAHAGLAGAVLAAGFDATPTRVKLTKKAKNEYAEREEDRADRWYVGEQLAQTSKVTELLEALSKLDAKTPADRAADGTLPDGYDPLGGFTVSVTAQAKVVDGDTPPPARTYTLSLNARDAAKKKVAVAVAGLPRVSFVDDAVVALAERPPLAYRSRRLFDTAELKLDQLSVSKADGTAFTLANTPEKGQTKWTLTAPLTLVPDAEKASGLAKSLSGLEAVEYVDEALKQGKLAGEYGLENPRFRVAFGFNGGTVKGQVLRVGAARPGKEEAYARLGDGGVFTVSKTLVESLEKNPLDLLPTQLWTSTPDGVLGVTVRRGTEAYTLANDGKRWRLSGPFAAEASAFDAQPLAAGLAAPKAERYDAVKADPIKHGLNPDLGALAAAAGGAAWDAAPALTLSVRVREKNKDTGDDEVNNRTLIVGKVADGAPPPPADPGQPPPAPGRYARFADGPNTAVFVLPAAAFAPADRPALDWLNRELLALDAGKVQKITVAGPETATLTFDDREKAWRGDGFAADKNLAGGLAFTASNPPVIRLAAYGPAVNWAEYGLDKPGVTVTLATGGDKPATHTLKLGKELPSGERYIRVDDGPEVGVVSGATDATLSRTKLGLADRTLLTFDPTQVLSVVRKREKEEFELVSGTGWDVVKPTKFKADEDTVMDALEGLFRARAVRVAALEAKDPKEYGLDAPAAVLELLVGLDKPKTLTLKIGKADDKGDRFVQVESGGPVKVLAAGVANRLLADPVKFKDKLLGKFVDADKVKIARGDRTAVFGKVDGTWKMLEPVATDAEQGELDALIAAAANLRADELVAEKPADLKPYGLDKPIAVVKFFNGDKEVRSVLVGKQDGPRAFAKLEGGDAVVLFDAGLSAKLLAEYRKRAVWSGVDASQVQSLAVSSGGSNFAFTKAGTVWLDPAKPEEQPDAAKVTDTLAALAGLKAERFAADKDADGKLYGLDKPSRVLSITQQGGTTKTLHLGGEVGGTGGKQVYAKVDDKDRTDVFVLSEKDTATLTRDRKGYAK